MAQQSILNTVENAKETFAEVISANKTASRKEKVNFSKLMDNVSAKSSQVQSNFVSKAIKSNTSSINKKTIENNTTPNEKPKKQSKTTKTNDTKTIEKNDIKNQQNIDTKDTNNKKDLIKKNSTTDKKSENSVTDTKNILTTKAPTSEIDSSDINAEKETDINNSSPVCSSPVIFLENDTNDIQTIPSENNSEITTQETIETAEILNITAEIKLSNTDELIKKIEEFATEADLNNDSLGLVEKVTDVINNSDLTDESKQELNSILDDTKNSIQNTTIDSDSSKEIQKTIEDIISKLKTTVKEEIVVKDTEKINEEFDIKELKEIKKLLDEISAESNDKDTKETCDETKNLLTQTEEKIETNKDKNDIKEDLNKIKENLSKIKEFLKENIKDDKNAKDTVSVKETVNNENNDKIPLIKNLETKEVKLEEYTNKTVQATTISDSNTETKEPDQTNLSKDNTNKTTFESKDIKTDKTAKTIDTSIIETTEKETTIQTDNSKVEENSEQKTIMESNFNSSTNQDELSNNDNSNNQNNKDDIFKKQNVLKEQPKTNTIEQPKTKETNTKEEIEITAETDEVSMDEIEISDETSETKPQNTTGMFEKDKIDLIEEMTFENTYKESGALSVSDEIAKIAINANSQNNKNNVLPINQNNNIIKNISFEKVIQQNQNIQSRIESSNIFNQISDKLQNFNPSAAQKLTMVLRPYDLGRLSIELSVNEKGLSTHILVQNADVKNYIEKNIDSLRQHLSDAGVNVNTIQIKTAGETGSSTYEGNQNNGNQKEDEFNQQQNQQKENSEHKRNKQNFDSHENYDSFFSKNKNEEFSGVLNNTFNYILN